MQIFHLLPAIALLAPYVLALPAPIPGFNLDIAHSTVSARATDVQKSSNGIIISRGGAPWPPRRNKPAGSVTPSEAISHSGREGGSETNNFGNANRILQGVNYGSGGGSSRQYYPPARTDLAKEIADKRLQETRN